MNKIPLIMDLISGLLLAYDFFPKSGFLLRFHNGIKDNLVKMNTDKLTSFRTLIFNVLISAFLFSMLLLWALYKGSDEIQNNVLREIGFFAVGAIFALLLLILITMFLAKYRQQNLALVVGIIISMIAFIFGLKISTTPHFITSLIAFGYFCILFPFATVIAGVTRRALLSDMNRPFYIFAVFGLVLFVASKIIEITAK